MHIFLTLRGPLCDKLLTRLLCSDSLPSPRTRFVKTQRDSFEKPDRRQETKSLKLPDKSEALPKLAESQSSY